MVTLPELKKFDAQNYLKDEESLFAYVGEVVAQKDLSLLILAAKDVLEYECRLQEVRHFNGTEEGSVR
jgi:DNA-binding phage protein